MNLKEVYIVSKMVSYEILDEDRIGEATNDVCRVFGTEEKAIDYIRREIIEWRDSMAKYDAVNDIVDETQWTDPGNRAYFTIRLGNVVVLRQMYYVKGTVE